jgi:diketogulonate reductase-like aldo/keto reductase
MSVSEFALGAMMFGAMGNTDHDESVRMIHAALDAGFNFVDTADDALCELEMARQRSRLDCDRADPQERDPHGATASSHST